MTIGGGWEICERGDRGPESATRREFSSREWAFLWLCGFRNEATAMIAFRGSLSRRSSLPVVLLDDEEVLRYLAGEIARGDLYVVREHRETLGGGGDAQDSPAMAAPPPPPPLPGPRAVIQKSEMEDPVFPPDADLNGIAGVLKEAAELGTPFCEECMRAARA